MSDADVRYVFLERIQLDAIDKSITTWGKRLGIKPPVYKWTIIDHPDLPPTKYNYDRDSLDHYFHATSMARARRIVRRKFPNAEIVTPRTVRMALDATPLIR